MYFKTIYLHECISSYTSIHIYHGLINCSISSSESEELLVVLRNHIFFRFSNINMRKLREALERRSAAMAMEVCLFFSTNRLVLWCCSLHNFMSLILYCACLYR